MALPFFGHLGLKVVSIGLATLLWFLVAGQREAERSLRVPLEFQNVPEQLELLGEPLATVDVRVRGSSGTLGPLRGADLVAVLDLSAARPGRRLFHLTLADVQVPTGVRVLQVSPATLSLSFESSVTRIVPVVPDIDGEPASGFVAGKVTAEPSTVQIVGPESAVRRITEATTEPISIRGATAPVRDTATIGLTDDSVRLTHPSTAVVLVDIKPVPVDRLVEQVPIDVRGLGARRTTRLAPALVTVGARGPQNILSRLTPPHVKLFVDVSGLAPGQYNLPVRADPPDEFAITQIEPAQVSVIIR
jgi:YbbR domain-containing protein